MSGLMRRTEARRVEALATLDKDSQAELGQFFTPGRAACLLANMPVLPEAGVFRVLDPGAGAGSLSAAMVERVMQEAPHLQIDLVAVETDAAVLPYLEDTLTDCVESGARAGVDICARAVLGDYIELSTGFGAGGTGLGGQFDLVIMNPPYKKIGASSFHRRAVAAIGVECPNLYAAFLGVAAQMLSKKGQMVAITPRSFANGTYFGQFRRFLLSQISLDRLHVFESRSTVFSDVGVLQENIVFCGTRGGQRDRVILSHSEGHHDVAVDRAVTYSEVVKPGDPQQFIRITSGDDDAVIAETMARLPCDLPTLGLRVSTGKVVDFRCRDYLRDEPVEEGVPLVYPGNLCGGIVEWPRTIKKPQAFVAPNAGRHKFLLPSGRFVVVKRFSSKEERRRVVAAIWNCELHRDTPVAFENHLNVFHIGGGGLDRDLAVGLSLWLNSSLVDRFFRIFSGHTQVNAGDLRSLRFPSAEDLRGIGRGQPAALPEQQKIDALIDAMLADKEPAR